MPPLILTLQLDGNLQPALDELRQAHFPKERNYLSAHVTMFHALPGESAERIIRDLDEAAKIEPFAVRVEGLRFLGRGVAVDVVSERLIELRSQLAGQWWEMLSPQDRQKYRPHVTVQNKVEPAIARKTFEELSAGWTGMNGMGVGLEMWWYRGGPWERARGFGFGLS